MRSSNLPAGCSELMFLLVTAITATIAPSYLQFYTQTHAGHQCQCNKFRNMVGGLVDTCGLIVLLAFINIFFCPGHQYFGIKTNNIIIL